MSASSRGVHELPSQPLGVGPRNRLPDFFVVGQPKCGTTALHAAFARHPEIFVPEAKEPNFFSREWLRPDGPVNTLEDYSALFSHAGPDQRVGEASVFYLSSPTAPAAIARVCPDARIVAIVREPAALLHSLHLQFVRSGFEPEPDLRKALALERERRDGRRLPRTAGAWRRRLFYSDQVRYVEQLRRYAELFPRERILVLPYDDLQADGLGTLRRILRFIGVDPALSTEIGQVNSTVRVRFRYLNRIAAREQGLTWRAATGLAKTTLPRGVRTALRRSWPRLAYGTPPAPDRRLSEELRRRFKDEVVALSDWLQRDLLTLWGYDRLD
jgi:sulfotransferase family protein